MFQGTYVDELAIHTAFVAALEQFGRNLTQTQIDAIGYSGTDMLMQCEFNRRQCDTSYSPFSIILFSLKFF